MIPQAVRHLVIDLGCKAGQAAERCLNVSAGAAKPVIEIKVTKGSIEIVDPDKLHHPAAQPDAFRVSGRSVDRLRRFDELVDLVLAILGRLGLIGGGGLTRLIRGLGLAAALGESASDSDEGNEPGDGETARNHVRKLKHPSTHGFPIFLKPFRAPTADAVVMPFKWVPNAAEAVT